MKTHASHKYSMNSTTIVNTQSAWCEGVELPPSASPKRRAQTLATNSLFREPVDMYTVRNARSHNPGTELPLDFAAYIERSRAALESQRVSFERERAAFAQERRLWDTERVILKSRIAELEGSADKNGRKYGGGFVNFPQTRGSTFPPSFTGGVLPPGGGTDRLDGVTNEPHHVWEGPIPKSRPTRVFSDELEGQDISPKDQGNGDDNRSSLDSAFSQKYHGIGAPISNIDGSLDGIRLKSSRLRPNFVAEAVSESQESSLESAFAQKPNPVENPGHEISLPNLGPPEENLTKDAGHTPIAHIASESDISDQASNSSNDNAEEEIPLAPQTTVSLPDEQSYSYLVEDEPDDDPALTGPLGLRNNETADNAFLNELDQRLLDEAKGILSGPASSETKDEETDSRRSDLEEPEPEIRFRRTTNFGTAFGSSLVR